MLCGGEKVAQRGRPRIYKSNSEKVKAYRESKKAGGAVQITCYLSTEYRELLARLCQETDSTMGETISYLLDYYFESRGNDNTSSD